MRPIPSDGVPPSKLEEVLGKKLNRNVKKRRLFENWRYNKMLKGEKVSLFAVEKEDLEHLRNWRNNPDFLESTLGSIEN